MQIEINMSKLERGTHEGRVKVTRGGKTFYRKQRVGQKEDNNEKTKPSKSTVGFDEVLNRARKFISEGINVSSVVMREQGKYVVHIMGRYMEGEGVGSIGSQSLLEIHYTDRAKAELISERINKLKIEKKSDKLADINFDGFADMLDDQIDRVSDIYKIRGLDADDIISHIEELIPKSMIKEGEISLATEFVNRLFDIYKSKYGKKITGNKQLTRNITYPTKDIDYYRSRYN